MPYPEDRLSITQATHPDEPDADLPASDRARRNPASLHDLCRAGRHPEHPYRVRPSQGLRHLKRSWAETMVRRRRRTRPSVADVADFPANRRPRRRLADRRGAGGRRCAAKPTPRSQRRWPGGRETPGDVITAASCARLRVGWFGHRGVSRRIPGRIARGRPRGVARTVRRVRLRLGVVPDCEPVAVGVRSRLRRPHGTRRAGCRPRRRVPPHEGSWHGRCSAVAAPRCVRWLHTSTSAVITRRPRPRDSWPDACSGSSRPACHDSKHTSASEILGEWSRSTTSWLWL